MPRGCNNLCQKYKFKKKATKPHESKYKLGAKRCTICEIYLDFKGQRCPCCGRTLRINGRSRIRKNKLE